MNTIEIKYRRKLLVPFFAACVLLMVVCGYGVFFTDKYKDDTVKKVGMVAGIVFFSYQVYGPVKKLWKDQPVIVLADDSIVLHEKRTVVIPKSAIQRVEVVQDKEERYALRITTAQEKHETSLTWLDATPDQIKGLIDRYKQ